MNAITRFIRRLAWGTYGFQEEPLANPSEVLRVNRDDIDGTLEMRNLDEEDDNPSRVLRVSWIRRDDAVGIMETVWVTDEFVLN